MITFKQYCDIERLKLEVVNINPKCIKLLFIIFFNKFKSLLNFRLFNMCINTLFKKMIKFQFYWTL